MIFCFNLYNNNNNSIMNEIVNKFLLAGEKFMPKINLRQPGFTYSACRTFTKNKERIQKLKNKQKKQQQQ